MKKLIHLTLGPLVGLFISQNTYASGCSHTVSIHPEQIYVISNEGFFFVAEEIHIRCQPSYSPKNYYVYTCQIQIPSYKIPFEITVATSSANPQSAVESFERFNQTYVNIKKADILYDVYDDCNYFETAATAGHCTLTLDPSTNAWAPGIGDGTFYDDDFYEFLQKLQPLFDKNHFKNEKP